MTMSYQDEGCVVVRFAAPSGAIRCVYLHTEKAGAAVPGLVADALEVIAGRHGARWYGEVKAELQNWSEPHFFAGLLYEPLGHSETCTIQSRIWLEGVWRPVLVVDFTTRRVRIYDEPHGALGDEAGEGEEELLQHPPEDVVEWAAALEVRTLYTGPSRSTWGGSSARHAGPSRGTWTRMASGRWSARRTSGASASASRPRRRTRRVAPDPVAGRSGASLGSGVRRLPPGGRYGQRGASRDRGGRLG
jgi:hypothetical protein